MADSTKFGFWWEQAPKLDSGDGTKFDKWWQGSPQVQTGGVVNTQITPGAGALGFASEPSSLNRRELTPPAAALSLVGHAPTVDVTTGLGGIKVGVYVGDGAGSQNIPNITFRPLCVWIMGISGGTEIGAWKTRSMPSTASHPWSNQPSALATDRITGFDDDGFTVGSVLNSSGDSFFYVAWPAVTGVTAEGVYLGAGVSEQLSQSAITHWTKDNPSSPLPCPGVMDTNGDCFVAADVGRTLRKVSDGSVLMTIDAVTDSKHAHGTLHIAGTLLGTLSGFAYWASRQIPLGFSPDFAMLGADANPGRITPVQFAQDADLGNTAIDPPLVGAGAPDQNFAGTTAGNAESAITNGSSNLDVRNTFETVFANAGTEGYDATSINYYWFAAKANEAKLPEFNKRTWTGAGASSLDVTGLDFTPTFLMLLAKIGTVPNPPTKWKSTNAITGSTNTAPFNDGVAESDQKVSFLADGLHLASTTWEANLNKYVALFIAPVAVETLIRPPSGSLTLSGAAPGTLEQDFLTPDAGALTLASDPPSVVSPVFITPNAGALVLSSDPPTVIEKTDITPDAGALALTGETPVLVQTTVLTPAAGILTLASDPPVAAQGQVLTPDAGSLVLASDPAAVVESVVITPEAGALALESDPPTRLVEEFVTPGAGALVISSDPPTVAQGQVITPDAGALTLASDAPSVVEGVVLTPEAGALVLASDPSSVAQGEVLTPDAGSLSLVGETPTVVQNTVITPGTGSLSLASDPPSVLANIDITPEAGALTLTGYPPTIATGAIVPDAGALVLTGYAPTIRVNTFIRPGAGSLTLSGKAPITIPPFLSSVLPIRFDVAARPAMRTLEVRFNVRKPLPALVIRYSVVSGVPNPDIQEPVTEDEETPDVQHEECAPGVLV